MSDYRSIFFIVYQYQQMVGQNDQLGYSHYVCSKIRLLPSTLRLTPIIFVKKRPFGAYHSQQL